MRTVYYPVQPKSLGYDKGKTGKPQTEANSYGSLKKKRGGGQKYSYPNL